MAKEYRRRAHHAGSWYEDDSQDLSDTLQSFLMESEEEQVEDNNDDDDDNEQTSSTEAGLGLPRGIIAPHAGFSYSGPTAAYAYRHLKEALMRGWSGTVVVLHPSHHVYLDGCAISGASVIETPICNLPVDKSLRSELLQTGEFSTMSQRIDEMEHSGEMQYPYIAQIYTQVKSNSSSSSRRNTNTISIPPIHILPIMVGATSQSKHFGHLLAPILSRSNIFTVISTDFCHWGSRFGYSPTKSPKTQSQPQTQPQPQPQPSFCEIHEYIEWLDRQGMEKISLQDPGAFAKYMKTYKNTICGKYPIGVYLNALHKQKESRCEEVVLQFVKYAQSSRVRSVSESSVSYASAVARKIL
jgi:predicted class III extradiol MEMO1 family dioxygenase